MTLTSPEQSNLLHTSNEELHARERQKQAHSGNPTRFWIILTLVAFIAGSFGGYYVGINSHGGIANQGSSDIASIVEQINPPDGYTINASYEDIGPQLVAAGTFKLDDFVSVYQQAGQPLIKDQRNILERGSDDQVVFNQQNAYFLLNLFWALGLTNRNPILHNGPMTRNGVENVVKFASTGGWSLAARPVEELFSSTPIVTLTAAQQKRLEEVVITVFRPCCDNSTHFPDCNHGMAMLGLLELMASQGASVDEMFEAAKYANAYWYPRQTLELATYFQARQGENFSQVDARQLVSQPFSSLSGYRNVHQWLSINGLLPQATGGGNSCGV